MYGVMRVLSRIAQIEPDWLTFSDKQNTPLCENVNCTGARFVEEI